MFYVFLYGVLMHETTDKHCAETLAQSYRDMGHKSSVKSA